VIGMQEEQAVVGLDGIALPTMLASAVNHDPAESELNC
jgi:hypothetical protein